MGGLKIGLHSRFQHKGGRFQKAVHLGCHRPLLMAPMSQICLKRCKGGINFELSTLLPCQGLLPSVPDDWKASKVQACQILTPSEAAIMPACEGKAKERNFKVHRKCGYVWIIQQCSTTGPNFMIPTKDF